MKSLLFFAVLLSYGQAGARPNTTGRLATGMPSFLERGFCAAQGEARRCWSKTPWSGLSWLGIAHPHAARCRQLVARAMSESVRPGGYDRALGLLKQAIRLEPGYAMPRRALLHLYLSHHQWWRAAQLFRDTEGSVSKNDGMGVLLRAVVLTRAGRPYQAIQVLRRIMDRLQRAGGDARTAAVSLNDAAEVLLAAGMPNMAVDFANAAVKRRRRYLAAWYTLSAALLLDGRIGAGFSSMKGAMVHDSAGAFLFRPGLVFLGVLGRRFYLAVFLQRAGCARQAEAMWHQYMRRFKSNPYAMVIERIRRWKPERSVHSKGRQRCQWLGAQFVKGLKRDSTVKGR